MENFSFIKLFLNDFDSAKLADDTPISKGLRYGGFIVQKPNELFAVKTAGSVDISFIGGITVDLVDCSNTIVQNIDNNFFYDGFTDSSGIEQIDFEFGFIGTDYWTKQLYLRITDDVNGNVWYSNGFLVTYYETDLSARFDFTHPTKLHNFSYDLRPLIQSVRLAKFYDKAPVNKEDLKQYVQAQGFQNQYRTITTFLRKYVMEAIDYFVNDRLYILKSHSRVYLDGQRVVISDYKVEEPSGVTNWMKGEFVINKQNEFLTPTYQIYQYLSVTSKTPAHLGVYTTTSFPAIQLIFNKNITLASGFQIELYKDGVLQTIAPATYTVTGNTLDITLSYSFTDGDYMIVMPSVNSGAETFAGYGVGQWTFTISDGEFEPTEFNNVEFLI